MTRRRWIADEWGDGTAALVGAQAVHLAKVLRAEPGMRYDVVAGERVWAARIERVAAERVEFALEEELPAAEALPLHLLLAVFKFDRLEWAIEKATELGVQRVMPVIARRTEKHLAQAAVARAERWRRITGEAAKQSRRADVPVIEDPCTLREALKRETAGVRLLLSESERVVMLREALTGPTEERVMLGVGPEGGWTAEEEGEFKAAGWQAVSLGPRILRAETAVIAGVAVAASALLG